MRIALLTREYPPDVYGGAGVHVEHLARELDHLVELEVHCFGPRRVESNLGPRVIAHEPWQVVAGNLGHAAALGAASVDLAMSAAVESADLVHSHTWYTNFAGHLAKLTYRIPHVVTVHSLEPLRPWKQEQLGGGYFVSSFFERSGLEGADAIIAVSSAGVADIRRLYPATEETPIHVIPNGVDPSAFSAVRNEAVLIQHGIDPGRPIVLFVGRISRQKGIQHLLEAVSLLDPEVQLVVRAGAPDTPAISAEVARQVEAARGSGRTVAWISTDLPRRDLVGLVAQSTLLCSPSVYEPFGLVNAEAMACEVPVVASDVGGIPEVVEHNMSGLLVPFERLSEFEPEPADPGRFAADLAGAMTTLINDPARSRAMGAAGRRIALDRFSWEATARRTVELYDLLAR